ncbi:hypothetical protein FA13DRAFT_1820123 [Coprinellus micaceus]|uniref:Uncharacterized protein n=1 Tax=Coprinellus micaceus TaxID=71717 RepID=A0A4Y7SFL5_COPMI|nr:hypothetical protein FA13DRAFT_1820123 [Coprinellus micaceus]
MIAQRNGFSGVSRRVFKWLRARSGGNKVSGPPPWSEDSGAVDGPTLAKKLLPEAIEATYTPCGSHGCVFDESDSASETDPTTLSDEQNLDDYTANIHVAVTGRLTQARLLASGAFSAPSAVLHEDGWHHPLSYPADASDRSRVEGGVARRPSNRSASTCEDFHTGSGIDFASISRYPFEFEGDYFIYDLAETLTEFTGDVAPLRSDGFHLPSC